MPYGGSTRLLICLDYNCGHVAAERLKHRCERMPLAVLGTIFDANC